MTPEYMPWYHPGSQFLRCAGEKGCGALVVEGDIETHNKHHQRIEDLEVLMRLRKPEPGRVIMKGTW